MSKENTSFSTFRTYRCSTSQVSGNSITGNPYHYAEEMTTSELIKNVNDLKLHIRVTRLENEILERVIMRYDPTMMNQVNQALEYANKVQTQGLSAGSLILKSNSRLNIESLVGTAASPSRVLTSISRVSTRRSESMAIKMGMMGSNRINVLERQEMVNAEMSALMRHLESMKNKSDKQHALFKAMMEEIAIRITNIDKSIDLFKHMVCIGGWDKIAQRIPAEVWLRFMNEWAKDADDQIGKLRLRTNTLNTQFNKFNGEIKVKADFKELLRPVDFEKLKIENQECAAIIERKLVQLAEIKAMTGDANLNLTVHKRAMDIQGNYLTTVQNMIKQRKRQTKALGVERMQIFSQLDGLQKRFEVVSNVRQKYLVPDVMDYVKVKSEISDLEREIRILEGRLHLHNIRLRSMQTRLRQTIEEKQK